MLKTPLGEILVTLDNKIIEYQCEKIEPDHTCPDLAGRYIITVKFTPDGKEHLLNCFIKNHIYDKRDFIETGENLELKSFYLKSYKLSIGTIIDSCYSLSGRKASDYGHNYDTFYTKNGVCYNLLAITTTEIYYFGVAWINNVNAQNDIQTWFGADPFIINSRLKH